MSFKKTNRWERAMVALNAIPPITDESKFREDVKNETKAMFDTFTEEENMMIAFAPLVISHVAWVYTMRVVDECVEKRIDATKKLTRVVRQLQSQYRATMAKDLDVRHIDHITDQCNEFMQECNYDFTILWFSVNQALKTAHPDDPYMNIRTNTYCAIIAIRVLREHTKKMNAMIQAKMPTALVYPINPHIEALECLLDGYMSDFTIDETIHITRCREIFTKNIDKIEWGVIDEEPGN